MNRFLLLLALALAFPAVAQPQSYQGPQRTPYPGALPVEGPTLAIPVLQADLTAKAGSDTVRFARDSYVLTPQSLTTLTAQAQWLIQHPFVGASIEGHADGRQTRDYALALGERRAAAVRNYLIASGVVPEQLDTVSWGKERPANAAVHDATWLQNSRVVTVLKQPPQPVYPAPPPQPLQPQR
jgi:peptidoglycan-associated lipoprotein